MSVEDIVIQSSPTKRHGHVVWYVSPAVPAKWAVCLNSDESVFKISYVLEDGTEREIFEGKTWTTGRNAFMGIVAQQRVLALMDRLAGTFGSTAAPPRQAP